MQDQDEQTNLIDIELRKITKSYQLQNPFMINCFNEQFDLILTQLVLDYQFDFDKISLHLYYQFPQFEQKITSRTVALRWWQIHSTKNTLNAFKSKEQLQIQQKEKRKEINQNKFNSFYQLLNYSSFNDHNLKLNEQKQKKFFEEKISRYEKAISMAEILTEEQSQRFMIYKPKFIMDTEYRLQQFEVDQNSENLNKSFVQSLKRILSNEIKSQFQHGVFDKVIYNEQINYHENGNKNQINNMIKLNQYKENQYKKQKHNKKKQIYWLSSDEEQQMGQNTKLKPEIQQYQIDLQQNKNLNNNIDSDSDQYLEEDWQAYESN